MRYYDTVGISKIQILYHLVTNDIVISIAEIIYNNLDRIMNELLAYT